MDIVVRVFTVSLYSMLLMFFLQFSVIVEKAFAEVETGIDVGEKAYPFKLLTIDGKEMELESFAKDKVTLLVFGATWCPACRHEIPLLKSYYNQFKDKGLNVLGIDIQESEKKVKSFVEKQQIDYPVALDLNADIARLYKVIGIPLNIILDKNGIIVYKENKPPSKEFLEKLL